MRVILFGGAGYIGAHVALEFLKRGDEIGIFDNLSTGLRENVPGEAKFYKGDILNKEEVAKALSDGWDIAIHLAAFKAAGESMMSPEKYAENNIAGSLNIITGCLKSGCNYFVLSSSAAVYGEPKYIPIDEEHPKDPENYYGFTKLEIERNLEWFSKLKGLRYASLRYFNAAGYDTDGKMTGLEKNPANLLPIIMETAMGMREKIVIFGDDYPTPDGTCIRDYVHVTDLARAHVMASDYIREHDENLIVNLGSENGISVLEMVETAKKITGRNFKSEIGERRKGDPAKLVASSKKAYEKLGWKAEKSDIKTLLESTYKVYLKNEKK